MHEQDGDKVHNTHTNLQTAETHFTIHKEEKDTHIHEVKDHNTHREMDTQFCIHTSSYTQIHN